MPKCRLRGWTALALVAISAPVLGTPPPLDAYGELPSVEDIAISPDGTKLAAIRLVQGEQRLVVGDGEGKILVNAAAGKTKVRALRWADDDTVLVTNSATVSLGPQFTTSKTELTGTVVIPLDADRKSALVFANSKTIANTTRGFFGLRHIDGTTMAYFGGIELAESHGETRFRHSRTTLYGVDLKNNRTRTVAGPPGENHYRDWLIDASGKLAVTLDINQSNGDWVLSSEDAGRLATGRDPTGDIGLICFGKDGTSVIYSVQDESNDEHWFEVPLSGGTPTEVFADTPVDHLYIDRENGRLLGYRKGGEKPSTVMYDRAHQVALNKIFQAFPKRNVQLVDWTEGFAKVILRTNGNADSGTWYLVDVPGLRADPIGDERPAIGPDKIGPISSVAYTAADGLEMDGVLSLPAGREAKNLPVILLPHGGPHADDEVGFDWWAQAFASRGYAVFQPNFRGSTGRSDAFRNASSGEWGRKMQSDISDGLAELAKRGIVDPKRACIMGASYGGYAALAGVTLQHGIYRCAVAVAGVSDVEMLYRDSVNQANHSPMTWRSLREEFGSPKEYDAISPRNFAKAADAPVLLIHGKDDTVVPYRHSTVMADALKNAGKPYEFVTLKAEDHWLSRSETRKEMLASAMAFVEKYNPAD